jgi:hypothetical protein
VVNCVDDAGKFRPNRAGLRGKGGALIVLLRPWAALLSWRRPALAVPARPGRSGPTVPGKRGNPPKVFSRRPRPRSAIARKSSQIECMIAKTLFLA